MQIVNSQFISNQKFGIFLYGGFGPITNVVIDKNTLTGNNNPIQLMYTSGHTITNNNISNDPYGILFGNATGNTATGNTINYKNGCVYGGSGNAISNNTCTHQ